MGEAALGVRDLTPRPRVESSDAGPGLTVRGWRDTALNLGFVRVGVATVDAETLALEAEAKAATRRWVEAGLHGGLEYMAAARSSPTELLPGARSAIVALASTEDVAATSVDDGRVGRVAAYARGLDYHGVLKSKLWEVAQQLSDDLQRPLRARVCVDTAPLLERFWAARAGVAFIGKSTMAIAPGVGTNVLLGVILVDVSLPEDRALPAGCGECTLCIDACPTQAFVAPFVLDAGRCIATLTIENTGAIPEPLRAALSDRVFGCDECQTVCPYNASRKRPGPMLELAARDERKSAALHDWATLSSGGYKRLTRHSAMRRAPRAQLQRNAVVALGNTSSPTPADVALLDEVLRSNSNSLVREHAAWALDQLRARHTHGGSATLEGTLASSEATAPDDGAQTHASRRSNEP